MFCEIRGGIIGMPDPSPDGNLFLHIVILFALILVNAFFAMSEIAIISLNDNKLQKMAEEGNKKAQLTLKLTSNSSKFLSTIQVGVTLAGFLTSASASQTLASRFAVWLSSIWPSLSYSLINGISVVLITIIMSYFSLVLGELVPKRIAMHAPEKVSFSVVKTLLFISKILSPAVKFLSLSTNAILKLIGIDPNAVENEVTEEEIRMLVDVGEEKGVIFEKEKEMIINIFEFDDINAGDIMTHRTDITAVDAEDSLSDALEKAIEDGYSRIPVFEEDLDKIIGIIYVKDLLKFVGSELPQDKKLSDVMRPAYFVPETMSCRDLFAKMTETRVQMAIVVDEYGGTAGIITLEDLLESIVGNIQDEYDDEEEEISKIDDNTYSIDGVSDIDEVSEYTGIKFPDGDYDTLGGFLISQLGYLPAEGSTFALEYKNVRFLIEGVEEKRIGRVRMTIESERTEEPADKEK